MDVTIEELRAELRIELAPIRAELASIRAEFAPIRAVLDSLPLIGRSIPALLQDVRALRAAFNDFALTQTTAGEINALHADVNRVQAENAELAAKVATLERLMSELQKQC